MQSHHDGKTSDVYMSYSYSGSVTNFKIREIKTHKISKVTVLCRMKNANTNLKFE